MDTESPAAPSAPAPSAGGAGATLPLRFVGSGSEYFRIWIVNLLLILVTLGLYYPFAKVRRMKYFHGATELAGQPFGFHADPWKMFRGYLLVGAMVLLYTIAGQVSPVAGLVAFLIVAAIWPALWHSSLRFRFANTSWRGLRFHFRGTRGGAYKVFAWALLAGVAVVALIALTAYAGGAGGEGGESGGGSPGAKAGGAVVIGAMVVLLVLYVVGVPAFLWLLHRYRQQHLALGSEHTGWSVGVASYIKLVLKTLVVSILPLIAVGIVAAVVVPTLSPGGAAPGLLAVAALVVMYVGLIAVSFGYYTARLQDLMWNGTASRHIGFYSRLGARATMLLWAKNWLLTIVTLGLYYPFAQVAMARLRLEAVEVRLSMPLDELTARLEAGSESAAGDAAGDLLGWDIGL